MSPTEGVVLDVEGLETRFGHQTVHRDLSLQVRRGEVLAIVGGSGSGKTTLLRQLLGLERPVAGRVTVFGTDLARADAAERAAIRARWGVLFQQGGLFSALGALDNVALPLRELRRLDDEVVREVAALKLSMVGIGPEHHHKRPAQLSGGMARRVGLARAIALDPELLFLDEPTAGLDPIGAANFDRLLRDLKETLGLTVFLITHDLDTLYEICDRVAVIAEKKIIAVGTIPELIATGHPWIEEYFNGPRGRAAQASHLRATS